MKYGTAIMGVEVLYAFIQGEEGGSQWIVVKARVEFIFWIRNCWPSGG